MAPSSRAAQRAPLQAALQARQRAEALSSRLPPLLVAAERVAATVAQGVHARHRVGTGEAFWQFRRYDPGDPVGRIDWRQSAKSRHVFVRENEWEAAQSIWLWSDGSASMDWRSAAALPTKAERAQLLLLALACLMVRAGERTALLGSSRPPGASRLTLMQLATDLTAGRLNATGLPPATRLPRHAQVVLIGDLLAPLPELRQAITAFAGQGLRGHLLQVLDPAEEILPFTGRIAFTGLENEDELLVPRVEAVRDAYVDRLRQHRAGLSAMARAAGWSFACHHTDRPPQAALLALYGALSADRPG